MAGFSGIAGRRRAAVAESEGAAAVPVMGSCGRPHLSQHIPWLRDVRSNIKVLLGRRGAGAWVVQSLEGGSSKGPATAFGAGAGGVAAGCPLSLQPFPLKPNSVQELPSCSGYSAKPYLHGTEARRGADGGALWCRDGGGRYQALPHGGLLRGACGAVGQAAGHQKQETPHCRGAAWGGGSRWHCARDACRWQGTA